MSVYLIQLNGLKGNSTWRFNFVKTMSPKQCGGLVVVHLKYGQYRFRDAIYDLHCK